MLFTAIHFHKIPNREVIMSRYIIALDQGSTSSRAIIFDENLSIVSVAQNEFRQIYPQSRRIRMDIKQI